MSDLPGKSQYAYEGPQADVQPDGFQPVATAPPGQVPPPMYPHLQPEGAQPVMYQPIATGPPGQTTQVVIQQTAPNVVMVPQVNRPWSTGLCSCFDDMAVCCFVTWCGSIAACAYSSDLGESRCLPMCVPGWLIALRTKLRTQRGIQGSIMDDCCTVCFCGPCALCQLKREHKQAFNM